MDEPAIDEEDVEPRFILFGPADITAGPAFLDSLSVVVDRLRPAALILRNGSISSDDALIKDIRQLTHDRGLALLAEDDNAMGFFNDGMHLSDPADVDRSRFSIGRDLPVYVSTGRRVEHLFGADAGFSRHDAMVAGEGGADYVAFGERDRSPDDVVIELIHWWREVAVVACLAYASGLGDVATLIEAGADFIGVSAAVWDHPEGPATGASEFAAAIEKS